KRVSAGSDLPMVGCRAVPTLRLADGVRSVYPLFHSASGRFRSQTSRGTEGSEAHPRGSAACRAGRVAAVARPSSKRSRNKLKYNPQQGLFELSKILPRGLVFPFDFGFIPSTVG